MTEVGPPESSESDRDADRAVHEFKIAKASPSIASGLKWRLSSALWPIDACVVVVSIYFLSLLNIELDEIERAFDSCNLSPVAPRNSSRVTPTK